MEHLYRFRSIDALLEKHQELENQEIYFSSLQELNDPIEGFKDLFWSGDKIVWKNLLKHYLLCLDHVHAIFVIGADQAKLDSSSIPIFSTENDISTRENKGVFKEICEVFFSNAIVSKYPEFFASRMVAVRRNEIGFYLRILHYHALNAILTVHEKHGHLKRPPNDPLYTHSAAFIPDPEQLNPINERDKLHPEIEWGADALFAFATSAISQMDLISQYTGAIAYNNPNRKFILQEFPEQYIKQIEKAVHSDWYTACFSENCNNSSMWGHYGDNHKGICLKFRTELFLEKPCIKLHGLVGWGGSKNHSGPIMGEINHQFYKINYSKRYPEIDFFRTLGRLSIPSSNWWYMDEEGNKSSCMDYMNGNESKWREKYWLDLLQIQTTKLEDWSYEQEYRLIISALELDRSNPAFRKLRFDLKDLDGIIFGINTTLEDKLRIMKIIETKSSQKNQCGVKFSQACYNKETGKIEAVDLSLVKL